MIYTFFYQIGASLLRNIGGEIGKNLRKIFYKIAGAKIGKGVKIYENIFIYRPYNLEIGNWTSIGAGAIISSRKKIKIGKNVGIGPHASIYDNDHKMPLGPREEDMIDSPIEINDGVWIGTHAIILKGVKIGKNATIGAGSVVNKDVPENAVVCGNPARIIKYNKESRNDK
ncbi:2,3,4,5-tetrahydropyridine-2,6-dicarboxylate N-acetyltransferase [uncultured archaeon]|nr:2,3,4,5-tetrahydropyridine-2,6-dicarboxylate N-acetyltransferase [uncultured archaeon]